LRQAYITNAVTRPVEGPINYILQVVAFGLAKRQNLGTTQGYVGANGVLTNTCQAATRFTFENGQLQGPGGLVSTNVGLAYVPLAASNEVGGITTTFAIVDSDLVWFNASFGNGGEAQYCTLDSTVEAVFQGPLPDNCSPVSISVLPGKS